MYCLFSSPLCHSYHLVQRWPSSDKRRWLDSAEAGPGAGDRTRSAVWRRDVQMCRGQPGRRCWNIGQPSGLRWDLLVESDKISPTPTQLPHRQLWIMGNHLKHLLIYFSSWHAVPPVISSRGGTVTVVVNEAARLECEATGVPQPSLTWLKDGSPVASVSHGLQVPTCAYKSICVSKEFRCCLSGASIINVLQPDCNCNFLTKYIKMYVINHYQYVECFFVVVYLMFLWLVPAPTRCCLVAECCPSTALWSAIRAGTLVLLSTLEENSKESMTSGFMVSQSTWAHLCLHLHRCVHVCWCVQCVLT